MQVPVAPTRNSKLSTTTILIIRPAELLHKNFPRFGHNPHFGPSISKLSSLVCYKQAVSARAEKVFPGTHQRCPCGLLLTKSILAHV